MAKLCVSLTERTTEDMLRAMHGLPRYVDVAEVRVDFMEEADLRALCSRKDRPLIVTNRPLREGGRWQRSEGERLDLLRQGAQCGADFVDVELDSVAGLGPIPATTGKIVSYHNFQETPADLEGIFRHIAAAGADVVKIAVRATDIEETVPVLALLQRHAGEVPLIALSMGAEGIPTRVLAGKFGAYLSYACVRVEDRSAEGQVLYHEMEGLYRFSRIGPATALYGVVANPVAHSMSPAVHNAAFAHLGMDAVYLPFKVTKPGGFLQGYQQFDLRGLSVTIPHKEAMLPLMDEADDLTVRIGALNTVCIRNGRRCGYNTDVAAAISSVQGAADRAGLLPLSGCSVLLIGAGGAARAIAYGLAGNVGSLTIANRTVSRAEKLAQELGAKSCGLDGLQRCYPDILVNATSVGMWPRADESPVPAGILRPGMVVFDSVYNPLHTRLLSDAERAGCTTASGLGWFVGQAAAQFRLWTGQEAPRELMTQVATEKLQQHQ